jgi:hypothetical protein
MSYFIGNQTKHLEDLYDNFDYFKKAALAETEKY